MLFRSEDRVSAEAACYRGYAVQRSRGPLVASRFLNSLPDFRGAEPEHIATLLSLKGQVAAMFRDFERAEAKGLTYTTPPLDRDLEVVGYPVVTVYLVSDQLDADIHVTLSEVDPSGAARYVTEGQLRASNRATGTPPWNNLGLPWHPSRRADARALVPGQPARLSVVLQPTATLFNRGHRLRIAITGADADNTEPPPGRPTIAVLRDAAHPSGVMLPVRRP